MSRIRGIEVKVQKEVLQTRNYGLNEILKQRSEDRSSESKEDTEKHQIKELLQKLPKLDSIFEVHRKIGEGTFSSVYLGSLRQHNSLPGKDKPWFAIKHLVPTAHPARVEHELKCLQDIGGKDHVIGVDLCLRHLDTIVFVMPYIPHRKFSEYVMDMDAEEVRQYMVALLTALRHVHSFGVIHRDVKPSNFLYDRDNRRYLLVDFGLAQRLTASPPSGPATAQRPTAPPPPGPAPAPPGRKRARPDGGEPEDGSPLAKRRAPQGGVPPSCVCAGRGAVCSACWARAAARAPRAGTQGYRPPEVLLKVGAQGTAVDVWACGVVLASALTARYPLFRAGDDVSALAELADLLGTRALAAAARAMSRRVVTSGARRGLSLRRLAARLRGAALPPCATCAALGAACLCPEAEGEEPAEAAGFPGAAFSLARWLLTPDPRRRPTADEALQHPFLAPPT